jgi:hypothetical protein
MSENGTRISLSGGITVREKPSGARLKGTVLVVLSTTWVIVTPSTMHGMGAVNNRLSGRAGSVDVAAKEMIKSMGMPGATAGGMPLT